MKLTLLLSLTLFFASCASNSRQVMLDNELPERIMDARVELNAEYLGKPYDPAGKVNLWAQARPSSMGSSGMVFHYLFEPTMTISINGKKYLLKSGEEINQNMLLIKNVPAELIREIAEARIVTVSLVAEQGRVKYQATLDEENYEKFREFVGSYLDQSKKK